MVGEEREPEIGMLHKEGKAKSAPAQNLRECGAKSVRIHCASARIHLQDNHVCMVVNAPPERQECETDGGRFRR
jgi:hypothetical protein